MAADKSHQGESARRLRVRWASNPGKMLAMQRTAAKAGAKVRAVSYHIISPEGVHYRGENLSDFARGVAADMGIPAKRAIDGLSRLNPKIKYATPSWYGWTRRI